jgi:hypothetical protein
LGWGVAGAVFCSGCSGKLPWGGTFEPDLQVSREEPGGVRWAEELESLEMPFKAAVTSPCVASVLEMWWPPRRWAEGVEHSPEAKDVVQRDWKWLICNFYVDYTLK